MRVRRIPEELVRLIAAGEVIERPQSAAKELIENSLDAGAREIRITCEEGGIRSLTVTDDGSGIPGEDLPLVLERHTTSKLDFSNPWGNLSTFGFRGEALAALAASSELAVQSRIRESPLGFEVRSVPGRGISDPIPVAHPPGTTVMVKDLFAHLPARRKFLRSPRSEAQKVKEIVLAFLLSHPHAGFTLVNDGKTLLNAPPSPLPQRLEEFFEVQGIEEIQGEAGWVRYTAYLSPPPCTYPTSRGIYTFVNRRFVRDPLLKRLLLKLYEGKIPEGRYPFALLFLELPPLEVDVNVHPAKLEVRFARGEELFRTLYAHMSARFHTPVPSSPAPLTGEAREGAWEPEGVCDPSLPYRTMRTQSPTLPSRCSGGEEGLFVLPGQGAGSVPPPLLPEAEPLGTVAGRYILYQAGHALLILDQHAAHERIRFEEICATLEHPVPPQPLLFPVVWNLPGNAGDPLELLGDEVAEMGFTLEPWGEHRYIIRTVPAWCTMDPVPILEELLRACEEGDHAPTLRELLERAATLACHTAIRTGDPLNHEAQRELLERLRLCSHASTCPHGRPTFRLIPASELDRWFLR